jgi:peptide/nickel transport system permease protein
MTFGRYALVRTLSTFVVFVLALVLIAFIQRVVPVRLPEDVSPAVAAARAQLEDPPHEQIADFVWQVLGERSLGTSVGGWDVGERAVDAAFVSMSVAVGGLALGLLIAATLAQIPSRSAVRIPSYLLFGALTVWAGLWFAYYLGFKWGITPILGYCWPFDVPDYLRDPNAVEECDNDIAQWAFHLVLPWLTLALPVAAIYARVLRAVRLRWEEDRRLPDDEGARVRRARALKVVKLVGRDFGFVLGAATLVEVVFGLPGFGYLLLNAITAFDLPVGEGVLVVATAMALAVQLAVDLFCGWIEPELRRA